jgi:hypothetical protein
MKNHCDPILVRQTEIDDESIMLHICSKQLCGGTISSDVDLVPGLTQRASEKALNFQIVFYQKHPHMTMLIHEDQASCTMQIIQWDDFGHLRP